MIVIFNSEFMIPKNGNEITIQQFVSHVQNLLIPRQQERNEYAHLLAQREMDSRRNDEIRPPVIQDYGVSPVIHLDLDIDDDDDDGIFSYTHQSFQARNEETGNMRYLFIIIIIIFIFLLTYFLLFFFPQVPPLQIETEHPILIEAEHQI